MVKLNRQYFKPYTFKNDFENMCFEKEETFDDLLELAKSQNETEYHVTNQGKTIMNVIMENC